MAYERRDFGAGNAVATTITAQLTAGATTSFAIAASTNWPDGTNGNFFVALDPTTDLTNPNSTFEVIKCSTRSGLTVNIAASGRGAMGTSDATHASGARAWVIGTTLDLDEANYWVAELAGAIGAAGTLPVGDADNSLTGLAKGSNSTVLGVSSGGTLGYATVAEAQIASNAVTNAKLADDSVDSAEIADGAVDLVHMSANSVDSDQYVDGSIDTVHIADSQITNAKMADDAVDSAEIADGAIDTVHIADAQVTDAKLAAAIPRGVLGYAQVTADQTIDTTTADLTGLSVTVTPAASRRIRVTGYARWAGIDTATTAAVQIQESSTILQIASTPSASGVLAPSVVLTPSAASHTYKLVGVTTSASNLQAASTHPAFILVEDIGSSA